MGDDAGYELFDHTADLGVRVWAPTRAGLLDPARAGLYAAIGDVATAGERTTREIALEGSAAVYLLRDFVAELLHAFEYEFQKAVRVEEAEFGEDTLRCVVALARVDELQSELEREVKAVTYHALELGEQDGRWEAQFIVDI
jgi:SHS2 domain-containing protein